MEEPTQETPAFNPDGTFADAAQLRRAKVLNVVAGSMGALWWSVCLGSYFALFARALGAGEITIGLLATIPSLAHVFQIVSAYLVERLGRRKFYWAVVETTRRLVLATVIVLPFLFTDAATSRGFLLLILAVSSILGAAGFAPWYSWMADIIPERERGRFFGRRSAVVNIAIILLLPLFGRILDSFPGRSQFAGFAVVFGLAAVIGIADILVHSFIPEPPMRREERHDKLLQMVLRPFRDSNFRRFFFGWALWSFASLVTVPFYAVYYRENLRIDYAFLGAINSVALLTAVGASAFWGSVADRLGSKPVFSICAFASIPLPVVFFFATPDNARILLSAQAAVGGILGAGMNVGFTNLLMGLSPRQGRSMFVAVFFMVTGVIAALGPVLGGVVARYYDEFFLGGFTRYHNLMVISMVLYLFCLPLFLRIREVRAAPMGVVLGNIMMTNPVRTFARIGVLNAGRSMRDSLRAVRSLGASRTRLATEELLARLDDPSVLVREEAIHALGEIGDPSAVPALLERLKNPEAHNQLGIIRALGMIGDERALGPLAESLKSDDVHVRAAAARALGEMRDERAVGMLKELVRTERSQQVIANAIEALGETGGAADMWEILPYLRDIENPILKRQTALAVGNLLGKRDEFYRILARENRRRGREVARMAKRLLNRLGERRTSAELRAALGAFKSAYEREDTDRCVELLWEAGYLIARDAYRFQGPREVLLEVAILRDERFAAGLWFLHLLQTGEIGPTMDDALLGLYLIASGEYRDITQLS